MREMKFKLVFIVAACLVLIVKADSDEGKSLSEQFKTQYPEYDVSDLPYDYPDDFFDYDQFSKVLNDEIKKEDNTSVRGIVVSSIYFVIALTGLLMNVAAIFFSQRCRALQYSQILFLQNLCIACICLLVTLVFSAQYRLLDDWRLGSIMCKFVNCLKSISIFAQVFFLMAACADFVTLRKRPQLGSITRTVLEILTVVFGWFLSLGFASPMLAFAKTYDTEDGRGQCQLFVGYDSSTTPEDVEWVWNASVTFEEATMNPGDQKLHLEPECKDYYSHSYLTWIICGFVFTYIVPAAGAAILLVLYKAVKSPHSVLVARGNNDAKNRRARKKGNAAGRFMAAGVWIALLVVAYFVCWAPLQIYRLGRIVGFSLSTSSCLNLRDYSFVQGYLSCVLLPALVISYSKPGDEEDTSTRNFPASSTSSFASASSASSNRKSTSLGSRGQVRDDAILEQSESCLSQQRDDDKENSCKV